MTVPVAVEPELRYLFRFRDLVAKTIAEHRAVIDAKGACWWGWWKRPPENARLDLWEELAASAKPDAPVYVGLFDSGNARVYRAAVIGVIEPVDEAREFIGVPDGEAELIPAYYRTSPFSRAWLRLRSIEPNPISFFGAYSYAEAPQLAHFSNADLDRFKDKVITSADELIPMDTTIWKIRPSVPADSRTQIVLTTHGLKTPIASTPVECGSNYVLHITDPHFATGAHRDQHAWRLESEPSSQDSLVQAIRKALPHDLKVSAVLVTGDVTFLAGEDEFLEAQRSLRQLLQVLDLDTDRLVVVPGNHDIRWSKETAYADDAVVGLSPPEARANYEQFYRQLFGHPADLRLAMGRRYVLPSGLVLDLCALNSSSLETGKNFLAGMGRIQEGAFADVAGMLGWSEDVPALTFRLLALHHHLAFTNDVESPNEYATGFGMAIDAVRIQRMAAKYGVQLAVHGHRHRAFVWRSTVYELPENTQTRYELGDLSIVGGGSAGSTDVVGNARFFNLFNFRPDCVEVDMYRSLDGGNFGRMQTWRAQLQAQDGALRLAPWEPVK